MLIERIELHRLRIRLENPFITSLGPNREADNVVVIVHTNEGLTGHGECCPFWAIIGDTAETCLVVGAHPTKALIGRYPASMRS